MSGLGLEATNACRTVAAGLRSQASQLSVHPTMACGARAFSLTRSLAQSVQAFAELPLMQGGRRAKVKGRMFRIGHLGDCNDLTLIATIARVEMGLKLSGVALAGSGVAAAMDYFGRVPIA